MCSLQNDTTSSSSNDSPARTTIHATTLSPNTGSGLPTTAHSDTAESLYITSSTSRGHILRPAEFTISFNRSTMLKYPSSSSTPTSPVFNHPLTNVSAIALVDRKAQTLLPLTSLLSRHTGGRRETVPHRRESLLHTRCIQHHNVYGGHRMPTGDAFPLERLQDLIKLELGENNQSRAHVHRRIEDEILGERVVQGQKTDQPILVAHTR